MKGKEPATGLIHSLGNKIGREELIKIIFVLKWIVILGIRHGT